MTKREKKKAKKELLDLLEKDAEMAKCLLSLISKRHITSVSPELVAWLMFRVHII